MSTPEQTLDRPLPAPVSLEALITPLELALLGAIWGASFLFMRVAARDFGAFALVEVRLALGALVLAPFLWQARARFTDAHWPKLALVGALNSAIPFVLFAWAAQRAPAGVGAICNALTVLFTALIAHLFFGDRVGAGRALGLASGFVGVVVLASSKVAGMEIGWAVAAGTLAALCYGFAINLVKRHVHDLPPQAVAAATLSFATLFVLPFAIVEWPSATIPARSWAAAIALGVICTGFAFWLFYRLIKRIGGPRTSTVTYLVPLFGVAWAWLLLGEPLTVTMGLAGALILGGVVIAQRASR
jgi:drug/metabolite transporter (DMT)-like permease